MKKTAMLIFALSLCAAAQTSQFSTQVPTVTLSGPVIDPTITNHSGKSLIAALVVFTPQDKMPWVAKRLFTHDRLGLPDGGSEQVAMFSKAQRQKLESPIVAASVNAVIFADGEFRGEDSYKDAMGNTISAEFRSGEEKNMDSMRKVWQMAKAGKWADLKAIADGSSDDNIYAGRFIFEHDRLGNEKAVDLLKHWGLLPASTWKGGLFNKLMTAPGIQAIAEWFVPLVAHAQSVSYSNPLPYPQDSSTDGYHPTQWEYTCNTGYGGSTYPCPDQGQTTPSEGIKALCSGSPTYEIADQMALSIDDGFFPLLTINAGQVQPGGPTYTLKNWGVCNDPITGIYESYRYLKSCTGSGDSHPQKDYDYTHYVCGTVPLGYTG